MGERNCIRVVVADDHPVVIEGVSGIINGNPDMLVVAKARDWPEAVAQVMEHRPDIALLDLRMPAMAAAEAVALMRRECPDTRVVILSAFDHDEEVYGVVAAGAQGFLLKDCGQTQLCDCLRAVHAGAMYLAPGAAATLAARGQSRPLTQRQTTILQLLAEGKSNKEVGAAMSITEGTVKIQVTRIYRRLGVDGRTAAITKALRSGIVKLPKIA